MHSFTTLNSMSDHRWDMPLIILSDKIEVMSVEQWETGERWIEALDKLAEEVRGVVLPLELQTPAGWRQSLHGHV